MDGHQIEVWSSEAGKGLKISGVIHTFCLEQNKNVFSTILSDNKKLKNPNVIIKDLKIIVLVFVIIVFLFIERI